MADQVPFEGNDPGRLHDWRFDAKTETDAAIVDERLKAGLLDEMQIHLIPVRGDVVK